MSALGRRLTAYFTDPITPDVGFEISRTRLAGLRVEGKDRKAAAHVILPIPAGSLEPSFEGKNIIEASTFERVLREAKARLGPDGAPVALLVPETCVRLNLFTFDTLPSAAAERDDLLRWRLGKVASFKPAEMRLSYDVVKANGQTRVLVALARHDVVRAYEHFFGRLGLEIRSVGIPALHLPNLIRLEASGASLIVNIDEDYVSLIAVLDRAISLYRMKPFPPESRTATTPAGSRGQVLREVETTIRVLEDHEKMAIGAIWVRAAGEDADDMIASLREKWPAVRVTGFSVPVAARQRDQNVLAPLIGQLLR